MAVRKRRKVRRSRGNGHLRELIAHNVVASMQDESDRLVARIVDELLADPEVAKKIEYHTRQIFKTLADRM
ncbi:MAG: hypothetical protein HYZ53_10960 [Planctomycetes bacterium]|nr:hypothetical protein [Planctomycetota bacterium]